MLGTSKLFEQLHPALPPGRITREPETLEDDPVHLVPEQQLRQRELLLPGERTNGVIPDREEDAARNRFLVVLDLPLDVKLVLVLERAGRPLGHGWEAG